MLQGSDRLRMAGQILVCADVDLRQRLLRAANEIQAILSVRSTWPDDLRLLLDKLDADLRQQGSIDQTVGAADECLLHTLADEILDLIDHVDELPPSVELECE